MDCFGNFIWTFPHPPRGGNMMYHSSPAVADVNKSVNGLEVIIGNRPLHTIFCFDGDNSDGVDEGISSSSIDWSSIGEGTEPWAGEEGKHWDILWIFTVDGQIISTPAVGDIDNDGQLEVVFGAGYDGSVDGKVYCLDGATGALKWSYQTGGNEVDGSAALADFDSDGDLEIIIGSTDGKLYFIKGDKNGNGMIDDSEVTFYQTGGDVHSSAAVGDVDGNGDLEVIVGSNDGNIYSFDYRPRTNTVTKNWEFQTGDAVYSSPALANRTNVDKYAKYWTIFRNNPSRTGFYGVSPSPRLDIYVGSDDGYLYLLRGDNGSLIDKFLTNGPIRTSPSVADVDGDKKLEIFFYDYTSIVGGVTESLTDEDGYYEMNTFTGHFYIDVHKDGYYDERYEVYVAENETVWVDITLCIIPGSISGRVCEADGVTPIQGASVWATREGGNGDFYCSTESNGNYLLSDVPPGSYKVRARKPGFAPEWFESKNNEVDANTVTVTGDVAWEIDFTLNIGGVVMGDIYDEDGVTPISGIDLTAYLPTGEMVDHLTNDYGGSYTFWLGTGSYLVCAGGDKYVTEWYDNRCDMENGDTVEVTASDTTFGIDFCLSRKGGITGNVYDVSTGEPISNANIYASSVKTDCIYAACSDLNGDYIIWGLPSGEYLVQAVISDYIPKYYYNVVDPRLAAKVLVNAPDTTFNINFPMEKGFGLLAPLNGAFTNDNTPVLDWSNVSVAKFYLLQVDYDSTFTNPLLDTYSFVSTYTFTDTLGDSLYYWRVRYLPYGLDWTPIWRFTVDTKPPEVPMLISPKDSLITNDNRLQFVWSSTADSGTYILELALDSLFTAGVRTISDLPETTYTVTDTLKDTIYYWHVKAIDRATNQSGWSAVWNFEIDTQAPEIPTLRSPIVGSWLNDTLAIFEWTKVTFLTRGNVAYTNDFLRTKGLNTLSANVRYVLEVDTTTSFTTSIIDTVAVTSDTLILDEGDYYWRVKAFDLAGNQGDFSNPDSFGIDVTAPIFFGTTIGTTIWANTGSQGPYPVTSTITDALSGVESALLYYSFDKGATWDTIAMQSTTTPDEYTADIPAVSDTNTSIYYYLQAEDFATNVALNPEDAPDSVYSFTGWVGVAEQASLLPTVFALSQNNPNPFTNATTICYQLPFESDVSLRIYSFTGQLVRILVNERKEVGYYNVTWDGRDENGKEVTSGIYFYKIKTEDYVATRKMILLR